MKRCILHVLTIDFLLCFGSDELGAVGTVSRSCVGATPATWPGQSISAL